MQHTRHASPDPDVLRPLPLFCVRAVEPPENDPQSRSVFPLISSVQPVALLLDPSIRTPW